MVKNNMSSPITKVGNPFSRIYFLPDFICQIFLAELFFGPELFYADLFWPDLFPNFYPLKIDTQNI